MHMGNKISNLFNNTIDVNKGNPLSPSLFGLCIYEIKQMVLKFVKEDNTEEVAIRNVVTLLCVF